LQFLCGSHEVQYLFLGENVRQVSVGPAAKRIGWRYFMSFIFSPHGFGESADCQ
jgi:hypothetical protein